MKKLVTKVATSANVVFKRRPDDLFDIYGEIIQHEDCGGKVSFDGNGNISSIKITCSKCGWKAEVNRVTEVEQELYIATSEVIEAKNIPPVSKFKEINDGKVAYTTLVDLKNKALLNYHIQNTLIPLRKGWELQEVRYFYTDKTEK